jgi:hypothetical protein
LIQKALLKTYSAKCRAQRTCAPSTSWYRSNLLFSPPEKGHDQTLGGADTKYLLFDGPTLGTDAGAKVEIHDLIGRLADRVLGNCEVFIRARLDPDVITWVNVVRRTVSPA